MFTLREALTEDATLLAQIGEITFREAYGGMVPDELMEDYVRNYFTASVMQLEMDEPSWFFIGEKEGKALGYIRLAIRKPFVLYIPRIYILKEVYGSGLAQLLLQQAIEIAKEKNCTTIELSVWKRNPRAIRFYEKSGFQIVGETSFEWDKDHVDEDWLMEIEMEGNHEDTRTRRTTKGRG